MRARCRGSGKLSAAFYTATHHKQQLGYQTLTLKVCNLSVGVYRQSTGLVRSTAAYVTLECGSVEPNHSKNTQLQHKQGGFR
jgi:hypothetical protein